MLRRFMVLALLAAPLAILAPSAAVHAQGPLPCTPVPQGNGSATCTIHMAQVQEFPVGPSAGVACTPDGLLIWDTTGVIHITINKAGDEWDTGTFQGPFTIVSPADMTTVLASGHGQSWFGDSVNNQNAVSHGTINFSGTTSTGMQIGFHEDMHVSVSASGMTVTFDKVHC
jgi:hypothetical protein